MAVQEGPTSVRVSWSPPTPLGDTSGYRIYYGSSGSVDVSGGFTDNYLLTDIETATSLSISIAGTSDHLPSQTVSTEFGKCLVILDSIIHTALLSYLICYRCSRELPGLSWGERSDILVVWSECVLTCHRLHPLLLSLPLLPPSLLLPVRHTHSGRILPRHLIQLLTGSLQQSEHWLCCFNSLQH